MTTLIKDGIPRLIITDVEDILITLTSVFSTEITEFVLLGADATFIQNMLRAGVFDLKVTSIRIKGELILSKSKGIGSVGEIIHIIGSKNEEVILEIKEDRFPGIFSATFKIMLSRLLNRGSIVVLIDDSLNIITAIIKNYNINKSGDEDGIITASISLEVFPILDQQSSFSVSAISVALSSLGVFINDVVGAWRSETRTEFAFIGNFIKEKVIANGR